jgi:hypothetical protein
MAVASRSRPPCAEKVFASGEVVKLNTKLDAASRFSLLVSHPGHSDAVTVVLHRAPQLRDGTMGTFVPVATVAVPAEGGRVEAYISGHDILLDTADVDNADLPALCFAKAVVTPSTPEGMVVGLTATLPA